jgi:SnoaL-like domain
MAEDDDILRANAAYYRAFATADFTAMSHIWAKEQVSSGGIEITAILVPRS